MMCRQASMGKQCSNKRAWLQQGGHVAQDGCQRLSRLLAAPLLQVTDPMEFTHCRYTPVVTEVRQRLGTVGQPVVGGH